MLCPILTSLLLIWLQTSSWFSTGHLIDIGTLLSLFCLVLSYEKRHEGYIMLFGFPFDGRAQGIYFSCNSLDMGTVHK